MHKSTIIIIVTLAAAAATSATHSKQKKSLNSNADADFLMLSLSWGPGACIVGKHDCVKNVAPKFTIHGLWAQKYPSSSAIDCPGSRVEPFRVQNVNSIANWLRIYWPSLTPKGNEGFWNHEWEKHGPCVKAAKSINNALDYFTTGLDLFRALSLDLALKNNGLHPTRQMTYSGRSIVDALSDAHGEKASISCKETRSGKAYLTEAFFCYDLNLNPMRCPNKGTSCEKKSLLIAASQSE